MLKNLAVRLIGLNILWLVFLAGCEGGKSRGEDCSRGNLSSSPYGQCETAGPKPCPAGQTSVGGVCQAPGGGCDLGFHLENGQCVADGLACGEGEHQEGDRCVVDQLTVEIVSENACRNPENGATRLILQFVTRDQAGVALDPQVDANQEPSALDSQLFINDRPADVESLLSRDSELLKSDLAVSLVLDATYSMLQHNPPAFEPMKAAAVNVLQELQQLWTANDSLFHWELTWFDELIYRPAPNNRGTPWSIEDTAKIPSPKQGQFTGLWKAVHYGIGVHEALYSEQIAAGPRDQQVMIVFSDGDDNHSFFANDDEAHRGNGNLAEMLFWSFTGYPKTSIDDIKARLAENPQLRIYVIAFGDQIGEDGRAKLQELAQLSHGQYFAGSDSNNLGQLFDSVKKEFITMQTLGVETSLDLGQYEFSLRTKHLPSGAEGKRDFMLEVGAQLPECSAE